MEKFLKNPLYQGAMIAVVLLLFVGVMWDMYKNPKRDFFGLLKTKNS